MRSRMWKAASAFKNLFIATLSSFPLSILFCACHHFHCNSVAFLTPFLSDCTGESGLSLGFQPTLGLLHPMQYPQMRRILFYFQRNLSEKSSPLLRAETFMTKIVMPVHLWTFTKYRQRLALKISKSKLFKDICFHPVQVQMLPCLNIKVGNKMQCSNLSFKVEWYRKMQ